MFQCDIGIEVAERIFCRDFLEIIFDRAFECDALSVAAQGVAMRKGEYLGVIDAVWRFLRGDDPSLSTRIASRGFLPEGVQFKSVSDDDLEWAYGTTGVAEKAKYIATLFVEDLSAFIAEVLDCDFSIIRYKEQIAMSAPTFDAIYSDLQRELNIIEQLTLDVLDEKLATSSPDIVGFSIPFPGTLIMALRMAQHIKRKCVDSNNADNSNSSNNANITIAMGGGYVNTELRAVRDVRLFEFIDFLLFDDGELPTSTLAKYVAGDISREDIVSAKYIEDGKVTDSQNWKNALNFDTLPPPDFSDLNFEKYISLVEFTNPMHRLWSDGQWNKMTMAHGCYHARCTFCDTNLDYIGRYSPAKASTIVDRMESIMAQTGVSGFHFTDEALPPKLLREVSQIIIERGLVVSFWGNIRFEKRFDIELCELLAKAGCIAVSGGLEVASPRILKLIDKGVTIEQAVESCAAFNNAGIMVHAYLMYGFPTQSEVEAIESLEIVRQMFEQGVVQSAFWHCYAMTVHSPTGCNPAVYGSEIIGSTQNSFANNGVEFTDNGNVDWQTIGRGLKVATQNYMQGRGYDMPIKSWFGKRFKNPQVARNLVERIIDKFLG